jgi:hypothetical protein
VDVASIEDDIALGSADETAVMVYPSRVTAAPTAAGIRGSG